MGEIWKTVELRPHQKTALAKLKDGCILQGGVGTGKSRVALAYYALTEEHEDIYVITTAKKRDALDWELEAHQFVIGRTRDSTMHGILTVDSWNNIEKYRDVKNAFFVFDEQRLVGAGPWTKAFLKIAKNNRWILLSATPGDNWLDYIPVMIANGYYKNRTEFKREHVIYRPFTKYPMVERYVNVQRLVRQRNNILVHMPYESETVRHPVNVWCEYNELDMARLSHGLWNIFDDKPIVNKAEQFFLMRRVANSDPSRRKELLELVAKHPRLIVFYNFNYELDIIRSLQPEIWETGGVEFAEWNGHKHEDIPDSGEWLYAVQYAAGAEGWNCIETDAMTFWSLPYSYKQWEQAHGRIDRINSPFIDLYYYAFRSKSPIDWAIWRSLMAKQNFQVHHFELTAEEFYDRVYAH